MSIHQKETNPFIVISEMPLEVLELAWQPAQPFAFEDDIGLLDISLLAGGGTGTSFKIISICIFR